MNGLIIDSFAGGGGASLGIEWALGRSPDIAINHDPKALAMHAANHPKALHLTENIWKVDPLAVTKGKPVFLLHASPDCRHHSKAKGKAPVSKSVRMLADVVLRWAEDVEPLIITLENVEEFADWGPLDGEGKPCKFHKGKEFARWVRHLERLGYAVEWREIRASSFGAPTIRKRLFLVARRDKKPILWSEPTHSRSGTWRKPFAEDRWVPPAQRAPRLTKERTAAEIIDWSIRAPSIFMTKAEAKAEGLNIVRPLVPKSMARIAKGFDRHVMRRAKTEKGAFVVTINHGGDGFRGQPLDEPFKTVAAARDAHGLVTPFVGEMRGRSVARGADEALSTETRTGTHALVTPFLGINRFDSDGRAIDDAMPVVTANSFIKRPGAGGPLSVIMPLLSHAQQGGRSRPADEPAHTVTASAKDQNQVVMGYLVSRYGERPEIHGRAGQEPRSRGIDEPYPTVVGTGNGGDLAAVYLAQQNTDMIGHDVDKAMSTIVQKGCTQTPVMAYLAALQNNTVRGAMDEPVGTVMAAGNHHALIAPYLTSYYSNGDSGHHTTGSVDESMPTVSTKDRFSPVYAQIAVPPMSPAMMERAYMVARFLFEHGVWHDPNELVTIGDLVVWDIGMRMLTPRELARAQGFPDSYILAAPYNGKRLTETDQRHKIGNSVSPYPMAELIYANCVTALAMPDLKRRRRAPVPTWPGFPVQAPRQSTFLEAAE
jgi:DNA (cytosine-5)-methyltransferase 1